MGQHMSFRQRLSEAGEGVYNEHMTEADATYNAAENSGTMGISILFLKIPIIILVSFFNLP